MGNCKCNLWRGKRYIFHQAYWYYWLLLHFEDNPPSTCRACCEHLNRYLPNYDKSIPAGAFNVENVRMAIERARRGDVPPAVAYPHEAGRTTVYRLAERLLS